MVGVGHLIGYGAGTLNLPKIFGGIFGESQLKQLIIIAAAALLVTVGITSYAVQERVLISAKYSTKSIPHTYLF